MTNEKSTLKPLPSTPRLEELVGLFYEQPARLGRFSAVAVDDMPAGYRDLLAHEHHMTVTVERFHGSPVDVQVLRKVKTSTHYARMILLRRQSDQRVVQFGIVRLNLALLSEPVRQEIESERTPLGRVLIQHDVLRRIRLFDLWRVLPGPDMRGWFDSAEPAETFGRTAIIDLDGEPAIELLEIVAPL